jgi:hypothetical protein
VPAKTPWAEEVTEIDAKMLFKPLSGEVREDEIEGVHASTSANIV